MSALLFDYDSDLDELNLLFEEQSNSESESTDGSSSDEESTTEDAASKLQHFSGDLEDMYQWNMASLQQIIDEMAKQLNSEITENTQLKMNELNQQANKTLEKLTQIQCHIIEQVDLDCTHEYMHLKTTKKKRGFGCQQGQYTSSGNLYFRDEKKGVCPNNDDYLRRTREGEMFPMDLELIPNHVWTNKDKKLLMQSVKEQCIVHLDDQRRINRLTQQVELHTFLLKDLLAQVDETFQICWTEVSVYFLKSRHSAKSCQSMWEQYVRPGLNHGEWSQEENKRLVEAAKKYKEQNWAAIAQEVGHRSEFQCFVHFMSNKSLVKRCVRFTPEHDEMLIQLVATHKLQYGYIKWNEIDAYFPKKPKGSSRARYMNSLLSSINKNHFTTQEDLQLMQAVTTYGTKFGKIPKAALPKNRSLPQLRARYNNCLKHRGHMKPWTVEDDRMLMQFVDMHGASRWGECSKILKWHTSNSCRTRYLTIRKYLAKHPLADVSHVPRKFSLRHLNSKVTAENWQEISKVVQQNPNIDLRPKTKRDLAKEKRDLKSQGKLQQQKAAAIMRLKSIRKKLLQNNNTDRITVDDKMMCYNWYASKDFKFFDDENGNEGQHINYPKLDKCIPEMPEEPEEPEEEFDMELLAEAFKRTELCDTSTARIVRALNLKSLTEKRNDEEPVVPQSNHPELSKVEKVLDCLLQPTIDAAFKIYKQKLNNESPIDLLEQHKSKCIKKREAEANVAEGRNTKELKLQSVEDTNLQTVTVLNEDAASTSVYEIRVVPGNPKNDGEVAGNESITYEIHFMKNEQ